MLNTRLLHDLDEGLVCDSAWRDGNTLYTSKIRPNKFLLKHGHKMWNLRDIFRNGARLIIDFFSKRDTRNGERDRYKTNSE